MNNFTIEKIPKGFEGELESPKFNLLKNNDIHHIEENSPCVWVFGDACKDEWIYGSANRLNPESPCAILDLHQNNKSIISHGMSVNVFENILSLTKSYQINSEVIHRRNILFPYNVFLFSNFPEILTKTRYIDKKSGQTLLRVDKGSKIEDTTISNSKWFSYLEETSPLTNKIPQIIVISDYNKGFIDNDFLLEIFEFAYQNNILLLIDTKKNTWDNSSYKNLIIKVNRDEYNKIDSYNRRCTQNIIVTDGGDGCTLYQHGKEIARFPSHNVKVHNACGAGDTFLAAMVVALIENDCKFEPEKILTFANKAAGIAVTYPDVVAVKREELEEFRG